MSLESKAAALKNAGFGLVAIGGVVIVGAVIYYGYKFVSGTVETAKDVVKKDLNPTSDKNLAYRGVNAVGEAITGDQNFSLGSWLYDVFNPPKPTETSTGKTSVETINK